MTRGKAVRAFLLHSLLPVTAAVLLFFIFKSACMRDGEMDYLLLWILCGLPFGIHQNSFLYDGNLLYSKHSCSTAQFRGCPLQLSRLLFGHISRLCTADQFLYIRKAALDLVTRTTVDGFFLLFISYFHLNRIPYITPFSACSGYSSAKSFSSSLAFS